jgi:Mrp family chromosome partitioning ATPase
MLDIVIKRLEGFKVIKITLNDDQVDLQIQLAPDQNAITQESIIKNLLSEYRVILTFIVKESSKQFKDIIAIGSGKGGVGKSTVSLHLAFALKEMGYSVGILDADIYAPSMPTLLNSFEQPTSSDGRLIDPIKTPYGFELLSMGFFVQNNQAVLWQPAMLGAAFNQFLEQGNWQCDYLIVDLPPGTSEIHANLSKVAPQAKTILVTEPTKIAYADLLKMYITVKSMNLQIIGLVENKAYWECGQCHHCENYKTTSNELLKFDHSIRLPIFHHFIDLVENGYPNDYMMQQEKQFFHEIANWSILP